MKIIRATAIFLALTLLGSCSIRTELLVQNFTSENILLKITYNFPIEISEYQDYTLRYGDGILEPKSFYKNKTLKALEIIEFNQYSITVKIPSNSTSRIESINNYRYLDEIKSIEFNNEEYTISEFVELTARYKSQRIFKINK